MNNYPVNSPLMASKYEVIFVWYRFSTPENASIDIIKNSISAGCFLKNALTPSEDLPSIAFVCAIILVITSIALCFNSLPSVIENLFLTKPRICLVTSAKFSYVMFPDNLYAACAILLSKISNADSMLLCEIVLLAFIAPLT